jgi:arginine decarboxylase
VGRGATDQVGAHNAVSNHGSVGSVGTGAASLTPVVDALRRLRAEPVHSLHMPGHKQRMPDGDDVFGADVWRSDLSEIGGFDYLHAPVAEIARSQELTAALFGAARTFFLVNGSTVGNLAALVAVCGDGDAVLMPRASHRSAYGGAMLSGAEVITVSPTYHPGLDGWFGASVHAARIAASSATARGARITAVHITNPSYYGFAPDLPGWRALADELDAALIVDEAHGTHFAFDDRLPPPGLRGGADIVVQSPHKTAGSLTQASWLHVQGDRVDPARLALALGQLQSSSPSALLTASLDLAQAQLSRSGHTLVRAVTDRALRLRSAIASIDGLTIAGDDALLGDSITGWDPTKLVMSAAASGLTGFELDRRLRAGSVSAEFADPRRVIASLTWADTDADIDRIGEIIAAALQTPDQSSRSVERTAAGVARPPDVSDWRQPETVMTIRAASQQRTEVVGRTRAIGRVSADYLIPYPPGIPLVLPGERLDAELLSTLIHLGGGGASIVGSGAAWPETVRVVS